MNHGVRLFSCIVALLGIPAWEATAQINPLWGTSHLGANASGYSNEIADVISDPLLPVDLNVTRSVNGSIGTVTCSGTGGATQYSLATSNRITLSGTAWASACISGGGSWDNHARAGGSGWELTEICFDLSEGCRFQLAGTVNPGTSNSDSWIGFGPSSGGILEYYTNNGSLTASGFLYGGTYEIVCKSQSGASVQWTDGSVAKNANANISLQVTPIGTRLTGMEVVQTIQDMSNSVPLIAGKPTFVRAYVEPISAPSVPLMNPRLRGYNDSYQELPDSPLAPLRASAQAALPNAADPARRADWNGSVNFKLPPSWTSGGVYLQLEMAGLWDSSLRSFAFNASPQLALRFVRIALVRSGFTNAPPPPAEIAYALQDLADLYPLNLQGIHSSQTNMIITPLDGVKCTVEELIEKMATERNKDESSALYVGVFYGEEIAGQLTGLSDGIPGNVVVAKIGGGIDEKWIMAHEIAHALGEFHPVNTQLFGVVGLSITNADPAFLPETNYASGACSMIAPLDRAVTFPFYDGTIARIGPMNAGTTSLVFGLDTMWGRSHHVISPFSCADLMEQTSCRGSIDQWISSHTYTRLLAAMGTRWAPSTLRASGMKTTEDAQPYVLIRGLVDFGSNTVRLLPFETLSLNSFPDGPAGDTHLLNVYGRVGDFEVRVTGLCYSISFTPRTVSVSTDTSPPTKGYFSIPVPLTGYELMWVEVLRDSVVLASRNCSAHSPSVQMLSPMGGEVLEDTPLLARWNASDEDGDPLTYQVRFSRDGGQTWQTLANDWPTNEIPLFRDILPASTNAVLKVIASDGMNSGSSEPSGIFTVANHLPFVQIVNPTGDTAVVGDVPIVLEAIAGDMDDGTLPDDSVTWISSQDGLLGHSQWVETKGSARSEGTHQITVTVVDSAGATNEDSVAIHISRFTSPQFSECSRLTGGILQLSIWGDAAGQQVLETSTNLTEWAPVSTNTTPNGLFDYLRASDPAKPLEYFRVQTLP